jgi:MFS family permease
LTYLNVYGTIINEYFSRYGLLDSQTSYISAIANLIGILGSISVSILIDKFKNYRKTLLSLSILGMFSHLLMTILLEFYEKYALIILLILWTLCSFSIVPIFTCSMDFVVELTYPVGESISGGLIMMVNQITGILAVRYNNKFIDK